MGASGAIVDAPLSAVAALNGISLPSAESSYALMVKVLQNNASPLIFESMALSASAITRGLVAYETTIAVGHAQRLE
ncbi:hypothetical protein [Acidovorax sp. SUPP3334]|uniref:hypothetical protein n=1 Tax=Acidovorax sp. SUPP3334 TaxID=2920881 RepID=UPI0023DE3D98|nr:hypothetical protein [Acidovorax sp. SUPP3334]GKT26508.1 hypothetical protein AVHM3334_21215 [Acidovorax sp. SUPP3334]